MVKINPFDFLRNDRGRLPPKLLRGTRSSPCLALVASMPRAARILPSLLLLAILAGCVAPDPGAWGVPLDPAQEPAPSAAPPAPGEGPLRLGPENGRAMEPHVAARGSLVVVADHQQVPDDTPGRAVAFAIQIHRSDDFGATWTSAPLPRSVFAAFDPLGRMGNSGDSVLAFAPDGDLYLAGVAVDGFSTSPEVGTIHDLTVFLTRSTDGGATWEPALFWQRGYAPWGLMQDKPWFAIGPDGTLHYVWTEFTGLLYSTVKYVRSTDEGATWSAPLAITATRLQRITQPTGATLAAPGDGRVYLSLNDNNRQLAWRSDDNGATFHGPADLGPGAFPRFGQVVARHGDPLRAFVLGVDLRSPPRVWIRETTDGGATWGPRLLLAAHRTGEQQHPAGWIGDDGRLHVAYYDAGWPGGERVVVATVDKGVVTREQPAPGDPIAPGPYRREYFGLTGATGRLWAAWVAGDGGSYDDPVRTLQQGGDGGTGTWIAVARFEL